MANRKKRVAVSEPSARVLLDWTPAQIRSAEAMADSGNLRLAADLCETLLADDRIHGVLSARTRGLLRLPITFEKSGDRRRSTKAVNALEADEDWFVCFPEAELGALLDWGILLGVGLGQNIWTDRENGRVVPVLQRYHPRWLSYDWNTRGWKLSVDGGKSTDIAAGDGQWVIHTPGGKNRPWVNGAWRAISRWWLLKHYARQDFGLHSEVHGQPIRVGVGAEGSTEDQREELADDLAGLGRETSITVPPGFDVKLVEAKARTWEMFKAQIELANNAIAICLAGQNLTTDVTGGSLAAAKVHQIIRGDLIAFDGESASTTTHDQSLVFWSEFNFGSKSLAPWAVWDTEEPEDELAKAQTRLAQAESITALRAAGIDVKPVIEEYGLIEDPEALALAQEAQQAQVDEKDQREKELASDEASLAE